MRLLIAEEHDLVREGLAAIVRRLDDGVDVLACEDFSEALILADGVDGDLDLAVFDMDLPGMSGVWGLEAFGTRFPKPCRVAMASYCRRQDALAALQRGVAGFVPKALHADAILNALRLVLSGERFVPAQLLSHDGAPLDGDPDDLLGRLTRREEDVLRGVVGGMTNKEIGRDLDVEEVTVKLHLRNIYRKLGARNRAQAVKTALDSGWRQ